jgi:Tetratricopeptide repeat
MESHGQCSRSPHAHLNGACGTVRDSAEGALSRAPHCRDKLNNLATLLLTQGEHTAAKPLFEHIYETALAPSTPDTAAALCNLASLLLAQWRFTWTSALLERGARAIYEKALGPMHLITPAAAASLPGEWRPTEEALKTQAFGGPEITKIPQRQALQSKIILERHR